MRRASSAADGALSFRASPDIIAAIDAAVAQAEGRPSRAEMVSRIVTEWLRDKGHLAGSPGADGLRPEDLNSSNDD